MRKILICIFILCLIALALVMFLDKIAVGDFEILGIKKILQKNDELDEEILSAKTIAEQGVEKKELELKNSFGKLNEKKLEYEQLVAASTEEEVKTASQFLTYNVEFLWTRIGNHAKKEGVKLKIDFKENTTVANNYNLDFTVTGIYDGITQFIYGIENDSELGFKIENFNMTSGSAEQGLVATFTCKNITVNGIEKSASANTTEKKETEEKAVKDNNIDANEKETNTTEAE